MTRYVLDIQIVFFFFFFKQKTAYEMRISDWSSDVCSSDLRKSMPTRTSKQLVSEANALVETIAPEDAAKLVGNPEVRFVDIREPGEVAKSGLVSGAVHVPRGLLEFQVDPQSPTHNPKLAAGSRLVLYCGSEIGRAHV